MRGEVADVSQVEQALGRLSHDIERERRERGREVVGETEIKLKINEVMKWIYIYTCSYT